MRFSPTFELRYVFPNLNGKLKIHYLKGLAKVSSQLIEQIPQISRPSFEI